MKGVTIENKMIDLSIQNLTKIVNDYDELKDKIEHVTDKFEGRCTTVNFFEISEPYRDIRVLYEHPCCGEPCIEDITFPVSWLSLTDDELTNAIHEYEEEQRRLEEEHARKRHEAYLKAQEKKEREEYEILRAKFEGEKE